MNKRKAIYKGFNKRRKAKHLKIIILAVGIFIVSGYGYIKIKDSQIVKNLTNEVSSSNEDDKLLGYEDYDLEKENNEADKNTEIPQENETSEEVNQDIKVAKVDPLNIYTIQVASVKDDKDMNKIEDELLQNKIPYSVVDIDGSKKVQTYASFDRGITENYLEEIKAIYPDAFISEMNVPVLALEYTSKYSYIENISTKLNELIKNFEEESKFWAESNENINIDGYSLILENRSKIITDLEIEAEKIDYAEMSIFKDNLINYTKKVNEEIDSSSKAAKDNKYEISKSLHLSSMQGYFSFINSIKGA